MRLFSLKIIQVGSKSSDECPDKKKKRHRDRGGGHVQRYVATSYQTPEPPKAGATLR